MKHLLLCTIGLLCLVQLPLFAQKTPKTYNLKGYLDISPIIIIDKNTTDTSDFSQKQFSLHTTPSFAFEIMRENKRFWQFRTDDFYIGHNEIVFVKKDPVQQAEFASSGYQLTSAFGSIVVEYGIPIKYNADKKTNYWVSFGLNNYLNFNKLIPFTTAEFPVTRFNIGTQLGIVPRMQYRLSEKINFEVNLPYFFGNTYYDYRHFESPLLPRSAQKLKSFEFDLMPRNVSIMLGMSIKI